MDPTPRRDGSIVTLTRVSRSDAQAIRELLLDHGIPATVGGGDADGWYPHLGFADGYLVQVFDDDLERARHLLESAPELTADDRW